MRNPRLTGVKAALSRLEDHHPMYTALAAKRTSLEAGIAGEQRVKIVFTQPSFLMKHQVLFDLSGIQEWFLLIGQNMTNKDCREFLHANTDTASRLLKSSNLPWTAAKRNRTYYPNLQIIQGNCELHTAMQE